MDTGTVHLEVRDQGLCYSERLVTANRLESDFAEWVFRPGMEFGSLDAWWSAGKRRARPHEGLDLWLFRTRAGKIRSLKKGSKIPVMWDGTLVCLLPDFLGNTLVVEHPVLCGEGRLCTLYAHATPVRDLAPGCKATRGQIIAALAAPPPGRRAVPAHLHFSVAWVRRGFDYEALDWKSLPAAPGLRLLDPAPFLSRAGTSIRK